MTEMFPGIPGISEVDPADGADMNGFGRLLVSLLHEDGVIRIGAAPSPRQERLMSVARSWLALVRGNVGRIGAEHRTMLMDRYDLLYRCVNLSMPDMTFIDGQRLSVVEAVAAGNKEIDLAETVWMVSSVMQRSGTSGFRDKAKPLRDSVLKAWVSEFESTGNFLGISQSEAVRRALTLVREDITPFIGAPEAFRQAVAARISLLFQDFPSKDTKTLESMLVYLTFARGRYLSEDQADVQRKDILRLLHLRPDLNRFDRLAYSHLDVMNGGAHFQ